MGGYAAGLGNGGGNTGGAGNLPLIPGTYDRFELTRDFCSKNIVQVDCFRDNVKLLTIALTYDLDDDLIKVEETFVGPV